MALTDTEPVRGSTRAVAASLPASGRTELMTTGSFDPLTTLRRRSSTAGAPTTVRPYAG